MFGVYVHIPYCLQRCIYCDFATVETTSTTARILPPSAYIDRVKKEILLKAPAIGPRPLDTVYFGGGTPSAVDPNLLVSVLQTLKSAGFEISSATEVTLEINPGTLVEENVDHLLAHGFNRFSVGLQTFNDALLKKAGRIHNSQQTRDTLKLLKRKVINYSVDLLFALPGQTLEELQSDLDEIVDFLPPHVSPYCLTVPEGHPFSVGRPLDEIQVEMFGRIEKSLTDNDYTRYEISNFSRAGFESRHNLLYWQDNEYWGLGNSAHSYMKKSPWGTRFWNPRDLPSYSSRIENLEIKPFSFDNIEESEGETLKMNQSQTDYFHTSLRMPMGLSEKRFFEKYKIPMRDVAEKSLSKLTDRGLIKNQGDLWGLTDQGLLLSNLVFQELTFL